MPVLVITAGTPVITLPPAAPPRPSAVPVGQGYASATWTTPDGELWELTGDLNTPGVSTLPGVSGIGAAPRAVSRRALATGGTEPRWSHADERLIVWPVDAHVWGDPAAFTALWRRLVRAFTSTSPQAGSPRPGVLRITRPDGSWREIDCIYLSGFEQTDDEGLGFDSNTAVVMLVASDPWWYGETVIALRFDQATGRSYLDPYETVSPATALGTQQVDVLGDVDALPVWTLKGPASTSFTVATPGGSFTFDSGLAAGETVTVDVGEPTVTDGTGADRIGDLNWPAAELALLPAGLVTITVEIVGAGPGSGVELQYRPRYESA